MIQDLTSKLFIQELFFNTLSNSIGCGSKFFRDFLPFNIRNSLD